MNLEQCKIVHGVMAEAVEARRTGSDSAAVELWIEAANLALAADDIEEKVADKQEAIEVLRALERNLANENKYQEVAMLLLGDKLFNSEPQCVKDVFEEVIKNHKLIILGSSSSSKTYSCGFLYYAFWRNDPYWTQIILAAPSEDHLYGNLFSHIVRMHKSAVIPLTDDDAKNIDINETDMFISMHDALPEMRIRCVLCKQNQVSATGLRGHKPKPRTVPHPIHGNMTRVYILIDEGTHVSPGAFADIKTTEASINPATNSVKIVMACNPEGITYPIVEMAEPEGGWDAEQVDTLYKWVSAKGYPVLRLDGKRSENVVQRKVIYEGLLSYETFLDFLRSGEHSGPYWAKGRGFPPLRDNAWTIIPPSWMNSQRGEPIYVGVVKNIGALDTALGGGDKALWGVGRWGEAAGWRRANGETEWFVNRANPDQRITKYVMVVDQIFHLPKSDNTVVIVQELMGRAKQMEIPPENISMDKMQPVSEPVLTPYGWREIGSLKPGDMVIGSRGCAVRVMEVHPRKDRRVMRVTFSGGEWTRCGPDHLWTAIRMANGINRPCVISTEDLEASIRADKGKRLWTIPMLSSPVEYSASKKLPIDPYLLGCLLGDGNLRKNGIRFTNADEEILDEIRKRLPAGLKMKHTERYEYSIYNPVYVRAANGRDFGRGRNPLLDALRLMGLAGKLSYEKFIPECYMTASPQDRIDLLSGLMDTDGFINTTHLSKSSASFGIRLTSKVLIHQIMEIAESMGGRATYRTHHGYSNKKKRVRDAHVTTIIMPNGIMPFKLTRKKNNVLPRKRSVRRYISGISWDKEEESVCIKVDAPDNLYVTRHCILTHNCGNASGVWSHAKQFWGDVLGIDAGERASEDKVLSDDLMAAYDIYEKMATELWFATKRWLDPVVCAVLINPIVPTSPLFNEMTTRRYRNVKAGKVQVEPKHEWRARNAGVSPDHADVVNLMVAWCRQRGGVTPGIMEEKKPQEGMESVSIKNADEPDTLETTAAWTSNRLADPE